MTEAAASTARAEKREKRHKTPLPPETHIQCGTCGARATLKPDWTPPPGLDQNLYEFRCIAGHRSYKTIHRTPAL